MKINPNLNHVFFKIVVSVLCSFPLLATAQYTQINEGPNLTPAISYIYVGQLTLDPSNASSFQKLKVSVIGEYWTANSIGETTYYIANRGGLTVNEVITGGSGLETSVLQCYQNGSVYSFYLYLPSSTNYYSLMIGGWLMAGPSASAATTVTIAGQNTVPAGTNITSSMTINPFMTTDAAGDISIGTATHPAGYKFAVNGGIEATAMTVKAYGSWPDYVFKKGYGMPALNEVEKYVELNHHLPEIPSAADIEKNGLNLGEMNRLLVKKVEELTLYLIDKDNQIKEQTEELSAQKKKVQLQEQRIERLESQLNDLIKKSQKTSTANGNEVKN